jgi:putative nucleotidyltransferase-like protein
MKAKLESSYAILIMQLLLHDTPMPCATDDVKWADFIQIAKANGVLLRVANRLKEIGVKVPPEFSAAVRAEWQQVQTKIELIHKVHHLCLAHNIDHIFVKVFQHYPDAGRDIDLWVSSRTTEVDKGIVRGLQASSKKRGLHSRIAGTTTYQVNGYQTPLDIHHGRMGSLGEHSSYLLLLLKNAGNIDFQGARFLVPSPEDQLIVQSLQGVYGRQYIRISDLVHTISLIQRYRLDWDYILKVSKQLGTFHGLSCYLSYTSQIYQEVFQKNLFSLPLTKALNLAGWGLLEFKEAYFRFPRIRVACFVYLKKFGTALLTNNWDSTGRLCLLPLIAVDSLLRRRLGWIF